MATAEKRIAEVIAELMAKKEMTVADLSNETGIPYNTLKRRVRTGRDLTVSEVEELAEVLGVSTLELLGAGIPESRQKAVA